MDQDVSPHPAASAPPTTPDVSEQFFTLTPERILGAVEVGGRRATGSVQALNSLENRVYDVELEDGERVVAKFYRPGRWSRAALLDEHALLAELVEAEVPAVAPLPLDPRRSPDTLGVLDGAAPAAPSAHPDDAAPADQRPGAPAQIHYALFPRVRGRLLDELTDDQVSRLGRLVARLHDVGAARPAPARPLLDPRTHAASGQAHLLAGDYIPLELLSRYRDVAARLTDACVRAFAAVSPTPTLRLHGDCHLGNVLWGSSGPFFIDFDDLRTGPPVQDLWLLAPGRDAHAVRARSLLVEGYESMRAFDRRTLRLVEPLRALRILAFAGWIAQRFGDPSFARAFPDFLEHRYWLRELDELHRLVPLVEAAADRGA